MILKYMHNVGVDVLRFWNIPGFPACLNVDGRRVLSGNCRFQKIPCSGSGLEVSAGIRETDACFGCPGN